jgi:glutamyl/glutaminyl-tRNA synthetase
MPESILAYLSSIGGGSKMNIFSDESFFTNPKLVLTDLISNFDETKISGRSIKLNQELLENLNKKFIKLKLISDRTELVTELKSLVQTKKPNVNPYYLTDEYLSNLIYWTQDRIHKLKDLVEDSQFSFLWTDMTNFSQSKSTVQSEQIVELVQHLNSYLQKSSTNLEDKTKLKQELKSLFENINNKKVNYWQLTRLVLIGSLQGPSIVEVLNILGKKNASYRLEIAEKLSLNDLKSK